MTIKAYILMNMRAGQEEETCKMLAEINRIEEVATILGEYGIIAKQRQRI